MTAADLDDFLNEEMQPEPPQAERRPTARTRPPLSLMLLRAVATVLFMIGWIPARGSTLAWQGVVWAAVAVNEGWRAGRQLSPARGT